MKYMYFVIHRVVPDHRQGRYLPGPKVRKTPKIKKMLVNEVDI